MIKKTLKCAFLAALIGSFVQCSGNLESLPKSFDDYPVYKGKDLGLTKQSDGWSLKVWSPVASEMKIHFYTEGDGDNRVDSDNLQKGENGIWSIEIEEPAGPFYTFQARIENEWKAEVVDPYVKLVGVNGKRGYFGLPSDVDPPGWDQDAGPVTRNIVDVTIYELHVRDLSMDESSGISNKGKFLGFTEAGTTTKNGIKTGLAHLKELGVTHIHLLPSFDYRSIDESSLEKNIFNWGYDPQNYNVPEGSYATDPFDPMARVREFKMLVKALHENGIGVILDVVYNHTGPTEGSLFNQLVPKYYYRLWEDGSFSDAAACNNETASERPMFRKFMIESMRYWVEEYHIDGFRVDLMGIHDIETMNLITGELEKINPSVFVYGEGWTASASPLPDSLRALKGNTYMLDRVSAFSDDLRDGIKGHWATKEDRGFVTGKVGIKETIKFGIVGSTDHPQVNYDNINYSDHPWAREPWQTMNYVSCHDDLTLWDKLNWSIPEATDAERIEIHKLANTIVLTSQGAPFLHGGVDFLRSKGGNHNSFESPDSVNRIRWDNKEKYYDVFSYYQKLIQLRKDHPAFRMTTTNDVKKHLEFLDIEDPLVIGYRLSQNANSDPWEEILVYFNGSPEDKVISIPAGNWISVIDGGEISQAGINKYKEGSTTLKTRSALILHN